MNIALFDLDGTIVDSGPTILASASETLVEFGYPIPEPDRLRRFVGPPINRGIVEVLQVPEHQVVDFRNAYRARYRQHMVQAPVYDGVPDLLRELVAAGWKLGVATSKREDMAEEIIRHNGLDSVFDIVAGADVAESRADKASVVERALELFADIGVDARGALMVGDRAHDVVGARAHGLNTVYVLWGYGSPAEIDACEPFAVARDVPDLRGFLGL